VTSNLLAAATIVYALAVTVPKIVSAPSLVDDRKQTSFGRPC